MLMGDYEGGSKVEAKRYVEVYKRAQGVVSPRSEYSDKRNKWDISEKRDGRHDPTAIPP
jgi:hypothetical protein